MATLAQPSAGREQGAWPGDRERKREKEAGQIGKHPHSLPQAWGSFNFEWLGGHELPVPFSGHRPWVGVEAERKGKVPVPHRADVG